VHSSAPGAIPDSGSTTVTESRRNIGLLFGFLTLVAAAALARGVAGGRTGSGRVTVAVIFGVLLLAFIAGWIAQARRRAHLEIAADAIRYVRRDGQVSALSREPGAELHFVKQHAAPLSRTWTLGLTSTGTDTVLSPLSFFSRAAVQQACRAHGWPFDDHDQIIR
jgi:hypothetical protein